jgi:hypothetical protein
LIILFIIFILNILFINIYLILYSHGTPFPYLDLEYGSMNSMSLHKPMVSPALPHPKARLDSYNLKRPHELPVRSPSKLGCYSKKKKERDTSAMDSLWRMQNDRLNTQIKIAQDELKFRREEAVRKEKEEEKKFKLEQRTEIVKALISNGTALDEIKEFMRDFQ